MRLRIPRRERWPAAHGLYEGRQCPYCGALVLGKPGQRIHDEWHGQLEADLYSEPEAEDPGGYVVGDVRTEEMRDMYAEDGKA